MNIFETEFAAYISAKKSGQRKEAMKALNAFLEDCKKLDLDAERKVAADFFKQLDADDRAFAYSFPLNSQLLFPVLQAWCAENPAESWIWRSFAEVVGSREYLTSAQGDILCIEDDASLDDLPIRKALCRALELDPEDHLARVMYIKSMLETLTLLLHDRDAGDDSAAPLIPEEANKIIGQLALLPDTSEKSQLTAQLRCITGDYL